MELKTILLLFAIVGGALASSGCKAGDRRPHPTSCRKYVECDKSGHWGVKSCNVFLEFDSKTKVCHVTWKVTCGKPECVEGEKRPVPTQCKSYTACQNGKVVKKSCSLLHGYNPKVQDCVYNYDCSGTPECADGAKKAIDGDCKNYMACSGGKFKKASCGWPKKFDWKKLECKFSAQCPDCKGWTARGVKGDCKKYQLCVKGRVVSKSCSLLHRYDPKKLECVWRWNVDCPAKTKSSPNLKSSHKAAAHVFKPHEKVHGNVHLAEQKTPPKTKQ